MNLDDPKKLGELVQSLRKQMGFRQKDLALVSGSGLRFIVDLEKGKPTCQVGKVLNVLKMLGIRIDAILPNPIPTRKK